MRAQHSLTRRSLIDNLGVDERLFRDEDAVEELTLVLASNFAYLLDLGAAEGESLVVNSFEDELALDFGGGGQGDLGASLHEDDFVLFAAQEVLDGDAGAVLGDNHIDGEMGVYQPHLVFEALDRSVTLPLVYNY